MTITKAEFDELSDPSVTKKRYDTIIAKINNRFLEIMKKISRLGTKGSPWHANAPWVDYDNCSYEKDGPSGYFDPERYYENISYVGGNLKTPEPWSDFGCDEGSFPTRWLWEENFFEEFTREVTAHEKAELEKKQKLLKQKGDREQKKKEMKQTIMQKLTKEELKYIKFK
jgi:hypothetical protein